MSGKFEHSLRQQTGQSGTCTLVYMKVCVVVVQNVLGEHANPTEKGPSQDSNHEPSGCEVTVLNTAPPNDQI